MRESSSSSAWKASSERAGGYRTAAEFPSGLVSARSPYGRLNQLKILELNKIIRFILKLSKGKKSRRVPSYEAPLTPTPPARIVAGNRTLEFLALSPARPTGRVFRAAPGVISSAVWRRAQATITKVIRHAIPSVTCMSKHVQNHLGRNNCREELWLSDSRNTGSRWDCSR